MGQKAFIVIHPRNPAVHMVLHRGDGRLVGTEPELFVGVKAEIFRYFEHIIQLFWKPLAFPAFNGLVPPHGPFNHGQAVDRLVIHDRAKTFRMIHNTFLSAIVHAAAAPRSR